MFWRIEIANKPGVFDAEADAVRKDIEDLGIKKIKKVQVKKAYILYGKLKKQHVERIACDILSDNITEDYRYFNEHTLAKEKDNNLPNDTKIVEVAYRPGVSDPAEFSVKKAIEDAGMPKLEDVKTARQYIIEANISEEELSYISQKALYNKLIQHILPPDEIYTCDTYLRKEAPVYKFKRIEVDLLKADDDKLLNISKEGQLFLNLDEMKMIQKYFRNLGRNPTDCELETIAQTWSEHCYHKTFRSKIEYEGEIIDGLLESTIMQATKILNKKWCVSVFKDNSGIIEFDDEHNVCFKVETHNHPSALEPYGGASTGIGGVIRDSLGTGLGAKPIANTDVFCFGPPDYSHSKLPSGTLHPKRIIKGVVSGVRDYGNRMGIPTVNGAVLFDEGYIGNPLVYCGNVGLMPKE
jgi:phosphoribosylformylglycinamidine synthase